MTPEEQQDNTLFIPKQDASLLEEEIPPVKEVSTNLSQNVETPTIEEKPAVEVKNEDTNLSKINEAPPKVEAPKAPEVNEAPPKVEAPKAPEVNEELPREENNQIPEINEADWQKMGQELRGETGKVQKPPISAGILDFTPTNQLQTVNVGREAGTVLGAMQTRRGAVPVVAAGGKVFAARGGRFIEIKDKKFLSHLESFYAQPEPEAPRDQQAAGEQVEEPKVPVEEPKGQEAKADELVIPRTSTESTLDMSPGAVEAREAAKAEVEKPVERAQATETATGKAADRQEVITVRLVPGTRFKILEDSNAIVVE